RSALLTGDIEEGGIESLLRSGAPLDVEVMELPHHGSWNAASMRLVEAASPRVVIVSGARPLDRRWWSVLGDARVARTASGGMVTVARDVKTWNGNPE
ncbi:MAG: hypothetical protein KDA28_01375, partial [Phycisphaerales bacterium]|nr:hypothetical protein [Phycisphaerales bacterium]